MEEDKFFEDLRSPPRQESAEGFFANATAPELLFEPKPVANPQDEGVNSSRDVLLDDPAIVVVQEDGGQVTEEDEPKKWDFFDDAAASQNGANSNFQLRQFAEQALEIPVLTLDEEKDLTEKVQHSGDSLAANKLFEANLRLVAAITADYLDQGLDAQKLIKVGREGLRQAIAHYDRARGYEFRDYVQWPVRHFMLKALNDRVTTKLNINVAGTVLKSKNNSADDVEELKAILQGNLTDGPLTDEANEVRLTMLLAISNHKLSMSEKEIKILELRYGLRGKRPQTPWAIAKELNLSLRQVYNREGSALRKFHDACLDLSRSSPNPR